MINNIFQSIDTRVEQVKVFFDTTLWQDFTDNASAVTRFIISLIRVAYLMVRELATGELSMRAMSLVYTTLLSIVPLIAVAFSVLKAFGIHNQMEPMILGVLEPLGAQATEISANIIGFVENVKVGVLGTLGFLMLFYTTVALIQKIESTFNYVWRVKRGRSLARKFTDYFSVVMLGPVLMFTGLGLIAAVFNHTLVQHLRDIEPFGTLILAMTKALPYFMIIAVFTFIYQFIPNTNVKLLPALVGASVAGALWVSVGALFASFVANSSNYLAIYSSFALLFFFMIWLYLAWFILLTGSQVAFYLQHPKLVRLAGKSYHLSARMREKSGLWLMTEVAKRYHHNQPPLSIEELEELTGLPNNAVLDLITNLEKDGFLLELAGESGRYIPARDIETIKVADLLSSLRHYDESQLYSVKHFADSSVDGLIDELNDGQQQILNELNLKALALNSKQVS